MASGTPTRDRDQEKIGLSSARRMFSRFEYGILWFILAMVACPDGRVCALTNHSVSVSRLEAGRYPARAQPCIVFVGLIKRSLLSWGKGGVTRRGSADPTGRECHAPARNSRLASFSVSAFLLTRTPLQMSGKTGNHGKGILRRFVGRILIPGWLCLRLRTEKRVGGLGARRLISAGRDEMSASPRLCS